MSGMFLTHHRASSALPKTITTSSKEWLLPTFAWPKRQKTLLMPGSSRTACVGLLKEALLLQVVSMWLSSVSLLVYVFGSIGRYSTVLDDPQMPGLIPLIKKIRPELPIVYRSRIEIRSDPVHILGSPQEEVWKYLWDNIQLADLFISRVFFVLQFFSVLKLLQVTPRITQLLYQSDRSWAAVVAPVMARHRSRSPAHSTSPVLAHEIRHGILSSSCSWNSRNHGRERQPSSHFTTDGRRQSRQACVGRQRAAHRIIQVAFDDSLLWFARPRPRRF